MTATKIYAEVAGILNLNWQEKRSEVRQGTYLRSSLQCLDNNDVLLLLESILQSLKEGKLTQKVNTARDLRAVQEHLMYGCGSIDFEEAYCSVLITIVTRTCVTVTLCETTACYSMM